MASQDVNNNTTPAVATPKTLSKDYILDMKPFADPSTYDPKKGDWMLRIRFHCHNLLQLMREGLFWTTSNVIPELGYIASPEDSDKEVYKFTRIWHLREYPDKPESECLWVATATLFTNSVQTLADFRLQTLKRRSLALSLAVNKDLHRVFIYNHDPALQNYNCFVDNLHPLYGSWWFWPMEEILDYDALEDRTKHETGSLI